MKDELGDRAATFSRPPTVLLREASFGGVEPRWWRKSGRGLITLHGFREPEREHQQAVARAWGLAARTLPSATRTVDTELWMYADTEQIAPARQAAKESKRKDDAKKSRRAGTGREAVPPRSEIRDARFVVRPVARPRETVAGEKRKPSSLGPLLLLAPCRSASNVWRSN